MASHLALVEGIISLGGKLFLHGGLTFWGSCKAMVVHISDGLSFCFLFSLFSLSSLAVLAIFWSPTWHCVNRAIVVGLQWMCAAADPL